MSKKSVGGAVTSTASSPDDAGLKKVINLIAVRAHSGEVLAVNLDEMKEWVELVFGGISLTFEQEGFELWCEDILSSLRVMKLSSKR